MERLTAEVDRVLRAAGWWPGRAVDVSRWREELEADGFHMHEAAETFLSEFGGIVVDISGPGVTCAREPFELDPTLCLGEEDRFSDFSEDIGHSIFPVGELDRGRFFLGIDEEGNVYLVETWVASFGRVPKALERLVLGFAPREIRAHGAE